MLKKHQHGMVLILMIIMLITLLILGCGSDNKTNQEQSDKNVLPKTNKVVVAVYGGDWEKTIRTAGLDRFSAETGIQVEVVPGADAEWYAKIRAANGKNAPYDLVILQPDTIEKAIAGNLLESIDSTEVPNLADIYPSATKRFSKNDKIYAVGFSVGQLGIAYRKDLVSVVPTKWSDLWNPMYRGHVAISPLTYSSGLQFFSGLIHSQGGVESNAQDVEKTFDKIGQLKDNVVAFPDNAGSIQTLLERGDVWLVPWWDGRAFAINEQSHNIGFVYPADGPVAAIASWVIPKGSKNLDNAHKLLNYLLSPEVEKGFGEASYYGMSNRKVPYSEDFKEKVHVTEADYDKLTWVDYKTATPKLSEWTNKWVQVMEDK